jgi:hypothetical protein
MVFNKTEHHTLLKALQVLSPGIRVPSACQPVNDYLDIAFDRSVHRLIMDVLSR